MHKVIYRDKAKKDITDILTYYYFIDINLLNALKNEIEKIDLILTSFPELYKIRYKTVRRVNLQSFPFCIFYEVSKKNVNVLRVLHQSRDPVFWT